MALRVLISLAVLASQDPAVWAGDGDCDLQSAVDTLTAVHEHVVSTASLCCRFQSDVYQRFSGYVIKFRVGELCEIVLEGLGGIQRLGAGSSFASSCDVVALEEAAAATIDAFRKLDVGLKQMLIDVGANDDGSFHESVREHLEAFAESAHRTPRMTSSQRGQVAQSLAENLVKLTEVVFDNMQQAVTYNVGALHVVDLPRFLGLLGSFPAAVPVEVKRSSGANGEGGVCREVLSVYNAQHVFDPISDPAGWRARDVVGLPSPHPSAHKLLFTVSKALPLSYNLVAFAPRAQVGTQELTSEYKRMFAESGGTSAKSSERLAAASRAGKLACNGTGLAYSPAHCLFDMGWGSMVFSLNTEPPFDGVLSVSEMSLKLSSNRPTPFVQPVANATKSLDELIELADNVYKSLNTPSPDLLFLSPMVGNCLTLTKLGPSRRASGPPQLTPKLLWVPVNPLVPPPWKLTPNFTEWHVRWMNGSDQEQHTDGEEAWWFAQCSLASAVAVLTDQGYILLHLEHSFAVFILKGLLPTVATLLTQAAPSAKGASAAAHTSSASLYDQWLDGWFCSPAASSFYGLEWRAGADLALLRDRKASPAAQRQCLCAFVRAQRLPLSAAYGSFADCADEGGVEEERQQQAWRARELQDQVEERGKAHLLESTGRGRCLSHLGFCECFPPYRGRFCEESEPGTKDEARQYRGVLHYLVGDKERLIDDFVRTLPLLWERFNGRFDYPVVIFHDGLAIASRQRILEASLNRVWFAYVDGYTAVPAFLKDRLELELGGYSIGYRGMCRFRSGPMFTQPVMSKFDYAWTLDTDGYFPAEIITDPFERMWHEGFIFAYSHISRDQASAVQHFWEHTRLYLESQGIDPKGTQIMRRITDALVLRDTYWHEWNRVLFMNDIEITQLAWFRGQQYQDFFRFLDSVGGFWLYRWGDHAVRTIALALWAEPRLLMKMGVPYGHQGTCRCGEEHPDKVCVRSTSSDWWRCVARSEAPVGTRGETASGEVGTVHESIMFGEDRGLGGYIAG